MQAQTFRLVECSSCGFVYVNPRPVPDAISAFYQNEDYQPFVSTKQAIPLWDRLYNFSRMFTIPGKRRKVQKRKRTGSLLDVGCGTGEFLVEMQRCGWQVDGVEKDQGAAAHASGILGREVHTQELRDCGFPRESFDVITMWHVLEHLYDPRAAIGQVAHLLRRDGLIVIAMPNISSVDARFYRENWVPLDSPRHLLHFTPATMKRLCDACGLTLVGHQQMVIDVFYNCLMSEKFVMKVKSARWFGLPFRLARALAVASISTVRASRMLSGHERRGSSVLYFIQKNTE